MKGKRVIVTGAGRGIGRAISILFAQRGAQVTLAARSRPQLEETAVLVSGAGAAAHVLPVDLIDTAQAVRMVDEAASAMGGLDVLVNNAGGWGDLPGAVGPVMDATPGGYDYVYTLNVRTPLFCSVRAAAIMRDQGGGGSILNMASVDGLGPTPGESLYGSAKAAMLNLTATMAYEFGHFGVRVNAIAPGVVETELTAPWLASERMRVERASFYPINRFGQPDDIAAAALYLCSDEASWVSGITLPVCGGQAATSDIFRWVRQHNAVPEDLRI